MQINCNTEPLSDGELVAKCLDQYMCPVLFLMIMQCNANSRWSTRKWVKARCPLIREKLAMRPRHRDMPDKTRTAQRESKIDS